MAATTTAATLASTLATALEGVEPLERVMMALLPLGLLLSIQRIRSGIELLTHFRIQEYL